MPRQEPTKSTPTQGGSQHFGVQLPLRVVVNKTTFLLEFETVHNTQEETWHGPALINYVSLTNRWPKWAAYPNTKVIPPYLLPWQATQVGPMGSISSVLLYLNDNQNTQLYIVCCYLRLEPVHHTSQLWGGGKPCGWGLARSDDKGIQWHLFYT